MVAGNPPPSKKKITVRNSAAPVEDDFLGLNGIYHCYTYINDYKGRNYTEQQAQTEFNRLQNMGVKIVRTYYNHEMSYNKQTGEFNWESDDMKSVYKWMQEMQKRDISVALNTGWSMRGAYIEDYYAAWLGCYVEGDLETTAKNQANWVKNSLNQFRAHGINNIDYLIMFTEPDSATSDLTYEQRINIRLSNVEDTYDLEPNVDRWLKCSRAIHNALVEDGTRNLYKTVGPNTARNYQTLNSNMSPLYYFAINKASDFIDIYSHHRYPRLSDVEVDSITSLVDELKMQEEINAAHNIGKKFWYDETSIHAEGSGKNNLFAYYNTDDAPIEGLHTTSYFADSMNRGVQNVMWWTLFDQQWPDNNSNGDDSWDMGIHKWGFAPTLLESAIPESSYYAASLLTKYFGNNAKVYKTESKDYNVGVQQDKNGDWSICLANFANEPSRIEIAFDSDIGYQKFYRHVYYKDGTVRTSEAKIIPADKSLTTSGKTLNDRIPANCTVVYTTIN